MENLTNNISPVDRRKFIDNTLNEGKWKKVICLLSKSTIKPVSHWNFSDRKRVFQYHLRNNTNLYSNIAVNGKGNPIFNEFLDKLESPEKCLQCKEGDHFITLLESGEKYSYQVIKSPKVYDDVCYITFRQQKRHYYTLRVICTRHVEFSFQI